MIADAHVHVWDPSTADYPWMTSALSPLDRTICLDEFDPESDGIEVGGVVLIQASDNRGDTSVMRRQGRIDPRVLAIVAWAPLDDPNETAAMLDEYRADPLVVGIRNLIHLRGPGWLDGKAQSDSLRLVSDAGLTLDFVTENHFALGELPRISSTHPDLKIVIDHLGKPPIGGTPRERAAWRMALAEAATNPNVFAKISGLIAPTPDRSSVTELVRPFIDDALDVFGTERLMFGSDWPLVERAGGYARAHAAISNCLAQFDSSQTNALFRETALDFYAIPEVCS